MMFPISTKMDNTVSCIATTTSHVLTKTSVVERVGVIKCDFPKYQYVNRRVGHMYGTSVSANRRDSGNVPIRCQMQVSTTTLEASVLLDKERVGCCELRISVDTAQPDASSGTAECLTIRLAKPKLVNIGDRRKLNTRKNHQMSAANLLIHTHQTPSNVQGSFNEQASALQRSSISPVPAAVFSST